MPPPPAAVRASGRPRAHPARLCRTAPPQLGGVGEAFCHRTDAVTRPSESTPAVSVLSLARMRGRSISRCFSFFDAGVRLPNLVRRGGPTEEPDKHRADYLSELMKRTEHGDSPRACLHALLQIAMCPDVPCA
jgi:hypothetical protein